VDWGSQEPKTSSGYSHDVGLATTVVYLGGVASDTR